MVAAGLPNSRVAAVTGGSRGIGRAVVEALLAEGWQVRFSSLSRASVDAAMAALGAEHGDRAGEKGRLEDRHHLVTMQHRRPGGLL